MAVRPGSVARGELYLVVAAYDYGRTHGVSGRPCPRTAGDVEEKEHPQELGFPPWLFHHYIRGWRVGAAHADVLRRSLPGVASGIGGPTPCVASTCSPSRSSRSG